MKYTLLLAILMSLNLVPAISQEETVIEVSCDDAEGCFGKVAEALQSASSGDVIELGSGLFFEKELIVDKSLTIRGDTFDSTEDDDTFGPTEIRLIEPYESAIKIVSTDTELTVRLEWITVRGSAAAFILENTGVEEVDLDDLSVPAAITFDNSGFFGSTKSSPLNLTLFGVQIASRIGVSVRGDFGLEIIGSEIYAHTQGVDLIGGTTFIRNSIITGDDFSSTRLSNGIRISNYAGPTRLRIHESDLSFWSAAGVYVVDFPELEGASEITLNDNDIEFNRVGVLAAGEGGMVEMNNNSFVLNEIGVLLSIEGCDELIEESLIDFAGTVGGTNNTFVTDEEIRLCPSLAFYNWPEDFISQDSN